MKYVLWVLQVLLGLAFVAAGFPKLIQPYAELAQQMAWVSDVPEGLVRFIGVAEVLGGLGLILPAATRILPWWLTPVAAAGLALDMLLATLVHLVRGEVGNAVVTLLLGLLAALVAYGRWRMVPILARRASRPAV
jgi:putative oxidoreductase